MRFVSVSGESFEPRPLPWCGADGKPAYAIVDPDRPGPVSRRADVMEDAQLEMAGILLGHARQLVGEAGTEELRYLVVELTRSLADVLRIALRVKS
ncbi:hypothetical protein ACFWOT_21795 [Streptomyces sp. NPDC058440]|uniref:hypothetical protein n=1 Tax=Streptomyces sp. NPDC058440 TaxID=3346501 RepID=UPI00364DBF65